MNELKAFDIVVAEEGNGEGFVKYRRAVYDKAEVDKVIAELKDKCQMHDFFWEGCGFTKRGFKNAIAVSEAYAFLETKNTQLKESNAAYQRNEKIGIRELRHQKYKRCLAMADLCTARASIDYVIHWDDRKFNHYSKWHDRWLIIADKFKETK